MRAKTERIRIIPTPADFNYSECLSYLNRNQNELLHVVDQVHGTIIKAINLPDESQPHLVQIHNETNQLHITSLGTQTIPSTQTQKNIDSHIQDWFDFDRNLQPFYDLAHKEPVLSPIVDRYKGLRMIGVSDLFEALCWAVLGQQVSLHVAYLFKKRMVEAFGQKIVLQDQHCWLFPHYDVISRLTVEDFIPLKFTQRKAEYIIGIAKQMHKGELSKKQLLQFDHSEEIEKQLIQIRGIGSWSAHYVMMRCLRRPDAFPINDVGLHNALKHALQLDRKPTIQEIESLSQNWGNWKAYAAFYLWQSIIA